ncbi:ABC transporter ATP-binding protein [Oceanirhabdus sp. W0125-5]|uniref:ABC transporter ATP-binding protein n=1 Tax=Oceanirhabdus sp. W0125-5 TaxID=2999116 RepID=UPI0022F33DA0|nr:ABC transporter ATP-binding protein [Oceanirhabdus sp. W0125-5]WBW94894.1 ABC transporter ATP-binding protein [Oceanirhabdus sp. W0125-5]
MGNVIEVKNLKRNYETTVGILKREQKVVQALKGVSFNVKKGEIFGLLGPNGAGKTTTIKILTTLLAPSEGEAKVLGYKSFGEEKKLRHKINFIFGGERSLYWRLSARNNLSYFMDLYGIDDNVKENRINELLKLVGLEGKGDIKVEAYSKGMKQRLQIARGLINKPEILFLDEPTIGLDPAGARDLRDIIKKLSKEGTTILLTTHYMQEAEELCDRIGFINGGKLVALDTVSNLRKLSNKGSIIHCIVGDFNEALQMELLKIEGVNSINVKEKKGENNLYIETLKPHEIINKVTNILKDCQMKSFSIREVTLEDIYLKIVGEKNE